MERERHMDAVVIELQGGLGNQLFQYAFACEAEARIGVPWQLDDWRLNLPGARKLALAPIVPPEKLIGSHPFRRHFPKSVRAGLERVEALTTSAFAPKRVVKESPGKFTWDQIDVAVTRRFSGYFQSWSYFENVAQQVVKDIRKALTAVPVSEEKSNRFTGAVHIRLGDYRIKNIARNMGCLTSDYYVQAIELAASETGVSSYEVFSDETEIAVEWLSKVLPEIRFISPDGLSNSSAWAALRSMSAAKVLITANSSLSAWAAWTNLNNQAFVVAPRNWFLKWPGVDLTYPGWWIINNELARFSPAR